MPYPTLARQCVNSPESPLLYNIPIENINQSGVLTEGLNPKKDTAFFAERRKPMKGIGKKELKKLSLQERQIAAPAGRNMWTTMVHGSVIEPKKRRRMDQVARMEIREYI